VRRDPVGPHRRAHPSHRTRRTGGHADSGRRASCVKRFVPARVACPRPAPLGMNVGAIHECVVGHRRGAVVPPLAVGASGDPQSRPWWPPTPRCDPEASSSSGPENPAARPGVSGPAQAPTSGTTFWASARWNLGGGHGREAAVRHLSRTIGFEDDASRHDLDLVAAFPPSTAGRGSPERARFGSLDVRDARNWPGREVVFVAQRTGGRIGRRVQRRADEFAAGRTSSP
jgi:hypothetical protein